MSAFADIPANADLSVIGPNLRLEISKARVVLTFDRADRDALRAALDKIDAAEPPTPMTHADEAREANSGR